jgi:hypothetical protein
MRFESVIKENRSSSQVLKDEKDAMRLPKTQVRTALTKRTAGEIWSATEQAAKSCDEFRSHGSAWSKGEWNN